MSNQLTWVCLGLFGLVTWGCQSSTNNPTVSVPPTPVKIERVQPIQRPVSRSIEQPGTIQAFEESSLHAKFPGYVQELSLDPAKANRPDYDQRIDIGSQVLAGQLLAVLSVPELDQEIQQKEALIRQAKAQVLQMELALAAAEAGIVAAKAQTNVAKASLSKAEALYERWQSELNRVSKLVDEGLIDFQSRDETENQWKAATANRAEAEAQLGAMEAALNQAIADRDQAKADITAAQAKTEVTEADALRVRVLKEYTNIKAPFAGVITHRGVNTGDFVQANSTAGMFRIARLDPLRVVIQVPEADSGLVNLGQKVQIRFQALNASPLVEKVIRTSWSLEPGSRTLRTELDLPNPAGKFRPGMYVLAKMDIQMPSDWSVPVAAVGTINTEPVVYLIEDGKANRVRVQQGLGDQQWTQILRYQRPGATDWIAITGTETIASPAAALTDGQEIK